MIYPILLASQGLLSHYVVRDIDRVTALVSNTLHEQFTPSLGYFTASYLADASTQVFLFPALQLTGSIPFQLLARLLKMPTTDLLPRPPDKRARRWAITILIFCIKNPVRLAMISWVNGKLYSGFTTLFPYVQHRIYFHNFDRLVKHAAAILTLPTIEIGGEVVGWATAWWLHLALKPPNRSDTPQDNDL